MAKSINTVPVSSKDTKVTTTVEAGDSWKSIGELAASLVRGAAK
jgi:hypothetical protein